MIRRSVAAALLALLLVVQPAAAWSWAPGSPSVDAERIVRQQINAARTARGLPLVHWVTYSKRYELRRLVRWRARDMAVRGYFSHRIPPTGARVFDYLDNYGITRWYAAAEVLAWNNFPDALAPKAAVDMWMRSDSHRAALLTRRYNVFAAGTYKLADGRKFFVVVLLDVTR